MKPRFALLLSYASLMVAFQGPVLAAPIDKQTSGTDLTAGASWVGGAVPGSADVATWVTGSLGGTLTMNSALTWQGIDVQGATTAITINGTGLLTLGSSGVAIAAGGQNLTIGANRTFGSNANVSVGSGRIFTLNGGTTTFGTGTTTTLNGEGEFSLSGAHTITGSGNVTISSGIYRNNLQTGSSSATYSGTTTLSSGAFLYSNTSIDSLGGSSANFVVNGGTIGSSTGSGARVFAGSATMTIGGDFTIANSGSSSALTFGSTSSFMNLGNGSRTVTVSSNSTFAGSISNGSGAGAGSLTKSGSATLTLTGTNTYTGGTTVNSGILLARNATALPNYAGTGAITVNHTGTLAVSAGVASPTQWSAAEISSLLANTNVTFASGAFFGIDTGGGSFSYGGGLTKANMGFSKLGSNTLTLTGTNTYSGATNLLAGNLQAGSANAFSANSDVNLASGTRLVLGGFQNTIGVLNGSGGVVENANATAATLTIGNTGASGSYSSNLQDGTGGGALTVIKTGAGAQAITNGTFTGGLLINQGTWQLGGVNGFGSGAVTIASGTTISSNSTVARTLSNTANTLAVNGSFMLGDLTNNGSLTLPGAVTLSGTPTITVQTGNSHLLSGAIGGTTFTKAGAGTLRISGSNNYSGGTTLNAGTLQVENANALGSAALTINGGTLSSGGIELAIANSIALDATAILSGTAGNQGMRLNGAINGSGGITKEGSGRVTLANDSNGFSGATTISAGILATSLNALASSASVHIAGTTSGGLAIGSNGTTNINNLTGTTDGRIRSDFNIGSDGARTLQVNQSVNGEYAGSFIQGVARTISLIKTGTATLTLSGGGGYTGGTLLRQGTIVVNNANALGSSGTVTINDAGTAANNTTLRLGNVTMARAITVANEGSGTVTLGASGAVALPEFSGAITINKAVTLDGSNNTDRLTFTGGISGNGDVTIAGTSRVVFNSTANTYNGSTIINAGSTLQLGVGSGTSTQFIPNASVVSTGAGSFLKLAKGSNNETIGGLAGSGTVRGHEGVTSAASVLTIDSSATHDFSGTLENGGAAGATLSLVKQGNGTQILSGNSTYTGATTVSAGTLFVNGTLGNSAVTVQEGATIGGTGTIAGSLSFAGAGLLEVVDWNDPLTVTGTITFGSGFGINQLSGIDWDALALGTHTLIATSQVFSSADLDHFGFANRLAVGTQGREAYFTNGSLSIVVIPEPSIPLLSGLGALLLLRRRRTG